MYSNAVQLLLVAQQTLNELDVERADEDDNVLHADDFRSRILFADLENGLDIEYYGEVWDEAWDIFLSTLCQVEISSRLSSLRITGPDEGANGMRIHDFSLLLNTEVIFPKLVKLYIRPTGVSDHNFVVIEEGQITPFIKRCPNLEQLTLPNAPESTFFRLMLGRLWYLRIGMAWSTHRFIYNMATHFNMPALLVLDYCDSLSVFSDFKQIGKSQTIPVEELGGQDALETLGYDDSITSFEDFSRLFISQAIKKNMVIHLRNVYLNEEQFKQLNELTIVQLSLSVEAPHIFISHWAEKFNTQYQHLIIQR